MLKYNLFDSYQVIIFDLDNTLYDESVYLFSAYNDIGKFIEKQVGGYSGEYVSFLVTSFKKYVPVLGVNMGTMGFLICCYLILA